MARRRLVAMLVALVVVAVTLTHEVLTPTPFHHSRPPAVFVLAAVLAAALLVLAPRVPSLPVALGAGIAAGGAIGTLVSGIAWNGVPDPFVRGGIAFNVSDLAIAVGDAILIVGVLAHAALHRADLRRPV
jgi:lipoprotein signal peptidase